MTLRGFNIWSVTARLILAMLIGAVLGYGRAKKRANAGLRTYILTTIGATLTTLISLYLFEMLYGPWLWAAEYTELKFDGSRFGAQVVNGIGFLAAGTILAAAHGQVSGLTTAIGLFTSACIGIALGAGFYEGALLAVIPIVIALEVMQPLEVSYKRRLRNITIYVEYDHLDDLNRITEEIERQNAQIYDLDIEKTGQEEGEYPAAVLTLRLGKENASHSAILSTLAELSVVHSVKELIA